MKSCGRLILTVVVLILSVSCASKHMKVANPETVSSYKPGNSEAYVIFMRPSSFGGAIQSSVFDVSTHQNILVGIVSSKTKVVYKTTPGEHLFMVIGESADFMTADLEAGKTYYSLVTPRMGLWKARFSLKSIQKNELSSEQFKDWYDNCEFVENTTSSYKWAEDEG